MTGNFSVELACLARRWWHSRLLIATPRAGAIAEVVHVTDPVAYAGSLIVIVGACLLAASIPRCGRRASSRCERCGRISGFPRQAGDPAEVFQIAQDRRGTNRPF